jgi:putative adhesin
MDRFETTQPIAMSLEIGVGRIVVEATDRADTVVDVQPQDPSDRDDVAVAQRTEVGFQNGTLTVEMKGWKQWRPIGGGRGALDVRIEVPAASTLDGSFGVGEIRATGRLGACRVRSGAGAIALAEVASAQVRSGAGSVTADVIAGAADIKTAGSVRIGRIDGSALLKNPNGDTWIGEVTGKAHVVSSNGSITIDVARGDVDAKTARGSIAIGEVADGAVVVANSAMGSLEIGVAAGTPAWLDLETRFGRVRNELDDTQRPEAGERSVDIRARTSMGDVTIRRAGAHASVAG